MKKIVLILSLVLLSITLIVTTALMEDHLFRGAGMLVGLLLFLSSFAVGDSTKIHEYLGFYCFVSGPILAVVAFFLYFFLEIHVNTTESNVKIVSRCYTRTLAIGQRWETKKMAYAFTTEHGFVDGIDNDLFYFVHTSNGTCTVCDRFAKQIELKAPVSIVKQDFKDGTLEFVRDGHGNIYDLHGRLFKDKESYVPIKNDYTIDDSPLN